MKRIFFVLLICVALLCVFLTPCFAAAETTASNSLDWTDPIDDSYYVYHTRSGRYWYYDLPISPAVAPIYFEIPWNGGGGAHVRINAGDDFYVSVVDGNYVIHVTSDGVTTDTNLGGGVSSSVSQTYYTTQGIVTTHDNVHLIGTPYVSGGSFINSGVSNAVGILGSIASWMLNDTVVLVVIGLAVGVTLIGWGIGKVKSTVKGY